MAPSKAEQVIRELYPNIMHEVLQAVSVDFEDAGVSMQILGDLKSLWEKHLTDTAIARFPWDPPLPPVKPVNPVETEPSNRPSSSPVALFNLEEFRTKHSVPVVSPGEYISLQGYATSAQMPGYPIPRHPQAEIDTRNVLTPPPAPPPVPSSVQQQQQQQQEQAIILQGRPQIVATNPLINIVANLTPLQRHQVQLGARSVNIGVAHQRVQQHLQQRLQVQQQTQAQQQLQIPGGIQTRLISSTGGPGGLENLQQQQQVYQATRAIQTRLVSSSDLGNLQQQQQQQQQRDVPGTIQTRPTNSLGTPNILGELLQQLQQRQIPRSVQNRPISSVGSPGNPGNFQQQSQQRQVRGTIQTRPINSVGNSSNPGNLQQQSQQRQAPGVTSNRLINSPSLRNVQQQPQQYQAPGIIQTGLLSSLNPGNSQRQQQQILGTIQSRLVSSTATFNNLGNPQQQQQQRQAPGTIQTRLVNSTGIPNNLENPQQQQQRVQNRGGSDMRFSSQGAHGLLNPGTAQDLRRPNQTQLQQPTQSTPKQNPPKNHSANRSHLEYYPYSSTPPPPKFPPEPPQLDGPSDLDASSASPPLTSTSLTTTVTSPQAVLTIDDEELNDGDDDATSLGENEDFEDVPELVVCLYDKVVRARQKSAHKWKCAFRDGVLVVGGKEYVFVKANAELTWA